MLVMNAALLGPHPLVVIQKFELKAHILATNPVSVP
jgi:hypothetical protein